jgi:hypothetical protein
MHLAQITAAAALMIWSVAASAWADMFPSIMVTPGPNKPIEIFHDDQAQCWEYADRFVRGDIGPGGDILGGAVVGAALGAILGSSVGGRHSHGASIGALGGAVAGTALGAHTAQGEAAREQRTYDDAYARCMYAHDNVVPGEDPTEAGPPPPPPPRSSPQPELQPPLGGR